MSWSFSVPAGPANAFRERAKAAADAAYPPETRMVEVEDQMAAAIDAGAQVAEAIVDDPETGIVSGSLYGHANAGHAPSGNVSISVASAVPG